MKRTWMHTAFFAGIILLCGHAAAQGQGDLDAVCGQATSQMMCDYISMQVSSTGPSGLNASCVWDGSACNAVFSVPEEFGEHNTSVESLAAACAHGNSNQVICESISSMLSSSEMNPPGIALSCVWNNPGAQNACSERVVLSASTISDAVVGGVVKGMSFIQGGASVTQVIVRSDPYLPYYTHVILNGSFFADGRDGEAWMHFTGANDITPTEFDFESIDPDEMGFSERERIMAGFQGNGPVEIGPGVGPDLSALKAVQTFTWNVSIPYNDSMGFAGVANCNGTYNGSAGMCQNAGEAADWISLEECATPESCPDGTYLKDVPSQGYLTIYGADPVPVYFTSEATTTTTSTTTSTTTAQGCDLAGDYDPCGSVSLPEVIGYINQWVAGTAQLADVVALINAWAGSA